MERAIIDLELDKLQVLHDNGYIHNSDYNIVETYTEKVSKDPLYIEALQKAKAHDSEGKTLWEKFYKVRKQLEKDGKA